MSLVGGALFVALNDYTKDGKMTVVSASKETILKLMKHLHAVHLEDAVCSAFEGVTIERFVHY